MAYAPARSMNGELDRGATEATYKQVVRDRGGSVEPSTYTARRDLNDVWFGIHETPVKVRPDGKTVHTPYYVDTPPAEAGF